MSDTGGGGPGIVIPIEAQDRFSQTLRRMVEESVALAREAGEQINTMGATNSPAAFREALDKHVDSAKESVASSNAALQLQTTPGEINDPSLTEAISAVQYRVDRMMAAVNRALTNAARTMQEAMTPQLVEARVNEATATIGAQGVMARSQTESDGFMSTKASTGEAKRLQEAMIKNTMLWDQLNVPMQQRVALEREGLTEAEQIPKVLAQNKILQSSLNAAIEKEIAAVAQQTEEILGSPSTMSRYEQALGSNMRVTGTSNNRVTRHHLGNLTSQAYKGFRGQGEGEAEGKSGLGGAFANVGGTEGITGLAAGAFGGYAAFMVGMYAVNDIARFFAGMGKEAIALQNALAPLTVTFTALGMSAGTLGSATSQALSLGISAGISPSQIVPVAGMAAAQFGAGGINQALTAATQYGKITNASPTDAYNSLRSIGVPFGESNLSNVSDTIVATSQKFGVAMQDVAQGLSQVALAAQNSGLTLNQTATIVGRAAQVSGLTSSTEGAAFARILTNLQTNLPNLVQLGQEMPSLGAQLTPDVLAGANPGEILGAIGRSHLTGQQQLLLAQSLGIGRQDVAALGVLRSVSDTNNGTVGGPTNTSGATTQMFNAEMSTFTGQLSKLGEELKTAGAEILGTVLPALTDLVGGLALFGQWVGDVVKWLNSASHNKWVAGIPVIGPFIAEHSGGGGGGGLPTAHLGPATIKYLESQNYTRADITDIDPAAKLGNYHAKPGGHLAKPGFGTVASGPTGPALSLNQAEILGADDPTLQSLFSTGQIADFGGFFQNLMGQRGSELGALKSGKLNSQGLADAAKSLQQIQSVVQQAVTLQTSETTSAAQVTSSGEGNVQGAQLKDQIDGAKKNVELLANVVAQDPTPDNIKAYNDAKTSENQLNNQLAAWSAQIAQQGLQASGALQQAQDLGSPVKSSQDQIDNLNAQISQLKDQAAKLQIDPQQAANQIKQLQAQVTAAQYQQAQTVFAQSQAPLTLTQGEDQLHGYMVDAAQQSLQLAKNKLGFLQKVSPNDIVAIDAQKLVVDQQTLAVMQAQIAQQVAGEQTQAALLRNSGQIYAADLRSLQAAKDTLAGLVQEKINPNDPAYQQAVQGVSNAEAQANQDYVTTVENHLQTMTTIHAMSLGQELAAYQQLLNSPQAKALGQPMQDQIRSQIQAIYNELAQNLQFDLPSSIDLKGLFYTGKRIAAAGSSASYMPSGSGAYQDNRNITVTINTGATTQQVQQALSDTLSTANRTSGTGTRLY